LVAAVAAVVVLTKTPVGLTVVQERPQLSMLVVRVHLLPLGVRVASEQKELVVVLVLLQR
jgi:hypothetical protein